MFKLPNPRLSDYHSLAGKAVLRYRTPHEGHPGECQTMRWPSAGVARLASSRAPFDSLRGHADVAWLNIEPGKFAA